MDTKPDPLNKIFNGSYPHLAWTLEEEEAFNLITPMEWPKPSLRVRFMRAMRSIKDSFLDSIDNNPHHFTWRP
jgi:hypothetical protein